jgi:acetyltransferase-like isoleucine patch superfamily enzyme
MIRLLCRLIASAHALQQRAMDRLLMYMYRERFASCGKRVKFFPTRSFFHYERIAVGREVFIGPGAFFSASESSIRIGNKVQFGPNVTVIGGDHNTRVIGEYMYDVTEKLPENDSPVVIEDDVWVGSNAIILKGVRVQKGSVVGAGALVIHDVPPYTVVGGCPARTLRRRFPEGELRRHISIMSKKQIDS